MKTCSLCQIEKPLSEFYKNYGRARADCKKCKDARNNKPKVRTRKASAELSAEQKAKRAAEAREYRARNRLHVNAVKKLWRASRAEIERVQRVARDKRAQPRTNARDAARRAAKLKATPQWADLAVIALFYKEARSASIASGVAHHVDHIVPLRSSRVCGLHNEFNLEIIPAIENWRKSNRTWPDQP